MTTYEIYFYYDKEHKFVSIFFISFPFHSKLACLKPLIIQYVLFDHCYYPAVRNGFKDRCLDVNDDLFYMKLRGGDPANTRRGSRYGVLLGQLASISQTLDQFRETTIYSTAMGDTL